MRPAMLELGAWQAKSRELSRRSAAGRHGHQTAVPERSKHDTAVVGPGAAC